MGKRKRRTPVAGIPPTSRYRIFIFRAVLTFAAIICGLSARALAQSDLKITGQVLDAETGAPVPGAAVSIDGMGHLTYTDDGGRFNFSNLSIGQYSLLARRVGYSDSGPVAVNVASGTVSTSVIRLASQAIPVGDLVVIKPRTRKPQIEIHGNTTTIFIQPGELNSIDDIARLTPELELVNFGHRRAVRIRGSQTNAVVVMLDGRIQNSSLTSTGDLSTIPLSAVSRVVIIKGGDYALSGLAGVINFITQSALDQDRLAIAAGRGSFDHETFSATFNKSHQSGISMSLDFTNSFSRGDFRYVDPRGQRQVRENNLVHDRSFFGQTGFSRDSFSVGLKGRYFDRHAGVPGPVFQFTPYATSRDFEREFYCLIKYDDGGLDGEINAGVLSRTVNYNSPASPTSFIPYNSRFSEQARDIKLHLHRNGRIDLNGLCSFRSEWLNGTDFIRPASSFGRHSRESSTIGIGAKYEFPFPLKLTRIYSVTAGVRTERNGSSTFWGPSFTYRLNFNLPADLGMDFSYFRAQRLPNLTDLFWKEDVFATPNPAVKPEKSRGFNLGFDLRLNPPNKLEIRILGHRTVYDDLIIWRKWGGDKFKPVNISAAEIRGWEFSLSFEPLSGPIRIFWNGSILESLNREKNTIYDGKYLTFRPLGSHLAGMEFGYGRFKASISGRHLGRRYMTEENTKSLPPVDILDFSMEYTLRVKNFENKLSFVVSNLGDTQYEILERIPEKPREFSVYLNISRFWEEK